MWGYGYGMGWWMWIPSLLLTVLVVVGVVVLVVMLMRMSGAGRTPTGHPPEDSARRILEERLARGELTPEEFRSLLGALEEGRRG